MSAPGKAGFSKAVYTRPRSLVDVRSHFCPGCHHGTIHKIVAECIDRYGLREKTIGVACVGFGFAACTQPHEAHEPQLMMALASFAKALAAG